MEANLLITYDPAHPGKAEREVGALLDDFGEFKFVDNSTPGVFLIYAKDAKKIVVRMRKLPEDSFEHTYKWIPIEMWVPSEIDKISEVLKYFNEKIGKEESWRLMLFKRQYEGHDTVQLIELLTQNIDHEKVDLKNPDKIIVVEIVGKKTGISLLDKGEYLDTKKM